MYKNVFKCNRSFIFLCCHNQEPEDKKSQCVDQKPVTASLALHQTLIMTSLFLCRHQTLRDQVSLSKNIPVSFEESAKSVRLQSRMLWLRGTSVAPVEALLPRGSSNDVMMSGSWRLESVAGSGSLSVANPCCSCYRVGSSWEGDIHQY